MKIGKYSNVDCYSRTDDQRVSSEMKVYLLLILT